MPPLPPLFAAPQDVYTGVCALVRKRVEADAAAGVPEASALLRVTTGEGWKQQLKQHLCWLETHAQEVLTAVRLAAVRPPCVWLEGCVAWVGGCLLPTSSPHVLQLLCLLPPVQWTASW